MKDTTEDGSNEAKLHTHSSNPSTVDFSRNITTKTTTLGHIPPINGVQGASGSAACLGGQTDYSETGGTSHDE